MAVYRLYNGAGTLLYVGCSLRVLYRIGEQVGLKDWCDQIEYITIKWYDGKIAAAEAETDAIMRERPLHNKRVGSSKGNALCPRCRLRPRLRHYCLECERAKGREYRAIRAAANGAPPPHSYVKR